MVFKGSGERMIADYSSTRSERRQADIHGYDFSVGFDGRVGGYEMERSGLTVWASGKSEFSRLFRNTRFSWTYEHRRCEDGLRAKHSMTLGARRAEGGMTEGMRITENHKFEVWSSGTLDKGRSECRLSMCEERSSEDRMNTKCSSRKCSMRSSTFC